MAHLLVTIARLMKPGSAKAIVAENLLLKQQLLVAGRTRRRAPHLSALDRLGLGFWSLFLNARRRARAAILLKPSTLLRFHAAVVMDQFTRRTIGFAVQAGDVDSQALCRMFNQAISKQGTPKYLSADHDPLFAYHQWQANLRILEVEAIKTVPYVPLSHPFIERLIGTVRREFLDHILFWNATDLQRKLDSFQTYYNNERVHASCDGQPPAASSGNPISLDKFR